MVVLHWDSGCQLETMHFTIFSILFTTNSISSLLWFNRWKGGLNMKKYEYPGVNLLPILPLQCWHPLNYSSWVVVSHNNWSVMYQKNLHLYQTSPRYSVYFILFGSVATIHGHLYKLDTLFIIKAKGNIQVGKLKIKSTISFIHTNYFTNYYLLIIQSIL